MAAPMVLACARFRTLRNLLPLVTSQSYCSQASKTTSKLHKRGMQRSEHANVKVKQNPFVPYVEGGDPIQQAIKKNSVSPKMIKNKLDSLSSKERKAKVSLSQVQNNAAKKQKSVKAKKPESRPDILNQVTIAKKEQSMRSEMIEGDTVHDYKGVQYQIINRDDDRRLVKTMIECNAKQSRQKYGDRMLHGQQLINDALDAGIQLDKLFFVEFSLLKNLPTEKLIGTKVYKVHLRHMKKWIPNFDYNSIVGVFRMPEEGMGNLPERPTIPVTLICEHVRFASSLGTLLHSAAAIGCERVLVMKGCIDPWNSKTLQHGLGSHFCLPILSGINWSDVPNLIPHKDRTIFAVGMDKQKEKELSETHDPIDVIAEIERVKEEEMFGDNDSVSDDSSSASDYHEEERMDSDYDSDFESDLENGDPEASDVQSLDAEKIPEVYKQAALHMQQYEKADYTNGHCVLVVSGNPSGISLPARKLVFDNFGMGIEVPSYSRVARLNIAMSGSITLFEVAKQFRQRAEKGGLDEDHVESNEMKNAD